MANLQVKDGNGSSVYLKATGTGTNGDPFITAQTNSLQVGGADVDMSNPVPVKPGTSVVFSTNVTQVGGTTISATNPFPVRLTDGTSFLSSIATDRTTAAAPFSFRLSDGSSFISPATDRTLANAPFSFRLSDGSSFISPALDASVLAVRDRFTTAVALSDALSNPTTTGVGAHNLLWDGTQWVRWKQATTGSITSLAGIPNTVPIGRYNATPITIGDGDHRALQLEIDGSLKTVPRNYGWTFTSDLTLDTSAYASGDSFCDLLTITNAVLFAGSVSKINSITLTDKSDQGAAMTIFLFDRSVTLPTKNAAWNVSATDMTRVLPGGVISILSTDWVDCGSTRSVALSGLSIDCKPNSGTSVYLAILIQGAGTYSANGVTVSIGGSY